MLTSASDAFIAALNAALPDGTRRTVEPRYLEEPRGRWAGQAAAVYAPHSTEEVSTILRHANAARVGVVPYGGGTGLVGGQVSASGPAPILLSMERMNRIRSVHPDENLIVAEAGCILQTIQEAAVEAGRIFPLSYGSEGTARIGGGLAVNSGGLNVLRYGNARDLCLGLEAVLPDGSIWNGLKRLRKDNTGYDLRNLLIGSEGTLGVITAAVLRLYPQPTRRGTAMMVVDGPEAALRLLSIAGDAAGEAISAFELLSGMGFAFMEETGSPARVPLEGTVEWAVLMEIGASGAMDPDAALESIFAQGLEEGLVSDGVIAQSESQRDALWAVREAIPVANKAVGSVASHDVSIPRSEIAAFVARATAAVAEIGDLRINAFGHLGDGNLHFNAFPPKGKPRSDYDHIRARVTDVVHEITAEMGGSFSAEHGVGRLKVKDLARYGDPTKLAAMRAIKKALDPNGIMNPGAVLPSEE